jgi:type I restriction enzyme M protein
VYQYLMEYWATTMQDDAYLIASDGWKAQTYRVIETKKGKDGKPGKQIDKGWACDLVPKELIVARFYSDKQANIDSLNVEMDSINAKLVEIEEEHGGDDGVFSSLDKINVACVKDRIKEIAKDKGAADELAALKQWQEYSTNAASLKQRVRDFEAELDSYAQAKYRELSEDEIKTLVVNDKWLATLEADIHGEMDRVSQALTLRVKELAERYEASLPELAVRVNEQEARVVEHLQKMGFAWN